MPSALVTGATSGIGKAAALALGDAGWWVLANGLDPDRGREVEKELQARHGGAFLAGDLTDDQVPQLLVDRLLEETGRIDLVVSCAVSTSSPPSTSWSWSASTG